MERENHLSDCTISPCICDSIEIKKLKDQLAHYVFNDMQGAEDIEKLQSKIKTLKSYLEKSKNKGSNYCNGILDLLVAHCGACDIDCDKPKGGD